jgi:hypothetical protein
MEKDRLNEHSFTGPKKPRGRGGAKKSLDLIEAMYAIAKAAQSVLTGWVGQ